ncbi:adenosylcobinamide-phosphate synthase CbiB [Thermohalobacter berrensis]|uniref:Cobalamin biosynthesis protein CobD n=1 Tax=Thermohalobacter berrensis TaxID=99594 RepID=A0A419SZE6_9FIRM|nr:adenosylcobinamide-phosphate synthase CbiB [Thermohalobacter berrensis]RKD30586.1 cobalamin biosynthesis protein CobD [Thermohalobacter berrensis]
MEYVYIITLSVILDYIIGDPPNWPHPIKYIGQIISKYERIIRSWRIVPLKIGGFLLTTFTLITTVSATFLILKISKLVHPIAEIIVTIYIFYSLLAAKCLHLETFKVYKALKNNDIKKARKLLSYLVGRDTTKLNEKEVTRAAVETLAENTIDGVLAPIFYIGVGLFLKVPAEMLVAYKTINTLDSMVGYMQEPYKEIGYASAKLDDIINYIPARLGSVLMVLSGIILGYDGRAGFKILLRDRRNHKSPNAGYPEAAVAGLLNIQLGGTNTYFGQRVYKPTIGDNKNELIPENIKDSAKIMYCSEILLLIIIFILVFKWGVLS